MLARALFKVNLILSDVQINEQLAQRPGVVTQYVEFDACGHVPAEEHPEKFVAAFNKFLDAIEPGVAHQRHPSAESWTPVADTTPAAIAGLGEVESVSS